MSSPELCLTVLERNRLTESRNFSEYIREYSEILKAKSKQPGFASLRRVLYLIHMGILIRSCQLIQKQEVLYSENNIIENVDPAFVGICVPYTEDTVAGSRWKNIVNTLLRRPDIFVIVEIVSLRSIKNNQSFLWSCSSQMPNLDQTSFCPNFTRAHTDTILIRDQIGRCSKRDGVPGMISIVEMSPTGSNKWKRHILLLPKHNGSHVNDKICSKS